MLVNNKESRVHRIGNADPKLVITLMPGNNDVPADAWKAAKKIAVVQHALKAGILVEGPGGESSLKASSGPVKLDDMTATEAIGVIGETYDKALLEKWEKSEQRKTVLDALSKQMDVIDAKADESEEDEGAK